MKILSIFLLMSSFAFANFNDFECDFDTREGKEVRVEVESTFGSGSRNLNMYVSNENTREHFRYFINTRISRAFNEIEFFGGGTRLEIDLWLDTIPRWGRTYQASYNSWDLDSGRNYYNINCRYTGR